MKETEQETKVETQEEDLSLIHILSAWIVEQDRGVDH